MRERLIESRLTPNAISLTGFALNLAAAALVVDRLFFLAGIAFIVGSVMDTLDGRYSRMSGKGTPFGAFLDSTLDRLEEGIVLTAVGAYFASRHDQAAVAAVVAAVLFSLMVSYTRARAEALGVACKVGLATRPVRVVILSIGLIFARGASRGVRARGPQRDHHDPADRLCSRAIAGKPGVTKRATRNKVHCDFNERFKERRGALPGRQGPRRHHRRR
jgi:CDP-diacylglycerol---glycerol-3-phosphate 3-phosphatidyltransferase